MKGSASLGMTVREAGRKGGMTVLARYGRAFYAEIGRKGQAAMRQRYPDMAWVWGKKGGRPRKPSLAEIVGEAKK